MIEIIVKLPNEVAAYLGETPEAAARQLLESAAAEGYRAHRLSRGQVREMLELDWQGTEDFLASHDCVRHYSLADLEDDRRTLSQLPAR
jgi:hypothetical protein